MPIAALADNNVTVIKPIASFGSYGTSPGQIDTPLSIHIGANDSVYILQTLRLPGSSRPRSAISLYDRNLTFQKTFFVLKKSMSDTAWEPAGKGFYYDDLASAFDIENNGDLYVLCGWDVVVLDAKGNYLRQFPVASFMGWIDKSGQDTKFYYPRGVAVIDDKTIMITSGSTQKSHDIILINTDGKLFTKLNVPVNEFYGIERDGKGNTDIIESGKSTVHVYDSTMTNEHDMPLYFNGTYNGNPAALAYFSDGNMTASANGIFIYDTNGSMTYQFMDNNQSENNKSWNRPIAVNSTDWLIVVSGKQDAAKTPQPILLYQYQNGTVIGYKEPETDVCTSVLGIFGLSIIAYLLYRRY